MFELSVALKYLMPRKRQLSVSIISLISILVISLVVWLILVFFSITNGLQKIWIGKMISLTAPVRVLPTEAYYASYYHLIDAYAAQSNYTTKSLAEKLAGPEKDPYNPLKDEELPKTFPQKPEVYQDLVKEAFKAIGEAKNALASPFEMTLANLKLKLLRENQSNISQTAYLGSFDPKNPAFAKTLLPVAQADIENTRKMAALEGDQIDPDKKPSPYWISKDQDYHLPQDLKRGQGILLPKGFKESGVLIGDRGYLSYFTPTASTVQEQRQPVFVAGFYDPGIIPVGGKFIITSPDLVSLIRSSYAQEDTPFTQGINLRFNELEQADSIKAQLERRFKELGIAPYFNVETYKEFDFTKDLIQQLHSEKNIFSLIAMVIIIVACSNIISMLIILVNDKKMEIGILRSMGASSTSIALIFGLTGLIMGLIGSLIGITVAFITLKNLPVLINLISRLQGFQAFNPVFFGNELPQEMSFDALSSVLLATVIISILSGIVPAVKASRMKPSAILRSE